MNEEARSDGSHARKTMRGAVWTVCSGMGGRLIGVIGTLVMTRLLHPSEFGEVSVAAIVATTANLLTVWGFGQYVVVKGGGADRAEVAWHAAVAYMTLGLVSFGGSVLLGGRLADFLGAPGAAAFIPGMALAVYVRRFGAIPERVLTRQMKFRASGTANMAGALAFTAASLSLAALGCGGWSMVVANILQSAVMAIVLCRAAGFASWARPTPLRWARFKDMCAFGLPLGIQNVLHNASRNWDNLAVSCFWGAGQVGPYNLAYNLADIPAIQVGEQIALVLMPSIASLPSERRPRALERASALLSLIIFPLAVGLGLVAYPLIALILPAGDWQQAAPLLAILACLSVFRPITWVLSAYMEAESKTNRLMFLELGKVVVLIGGIVVLAPFGLQVASFAVGIAFSLTAVAGVALVLREGPSFRSLLSGFLRPLAACGVMAAAALGAREALLGAGVASSAVFLVVMSLTGAVAYICAALVICRQTSKELLGLLMHLRKKRAARAAVATAQAAASVP